MRVVLASRNAHKLVELQRILAVFDVELVSLAEFPNAVDPAETGATFADNALIKARAAAAVSGLVSVADDSGISVDALNGMPGVLSARWAGRHGDDAANLDLMLAQIVDVPDERRTASFVCAAAAVSPNGAELVCEGRLPGVVLRERHGDRGFGYDPVFVPLGFAVTTAEMTAEQKDAISHRGLAFRELAERLGELSP